MSARKILLSVLFLLLLLAKVNAQERPTRFLFLFDCSGSMWADIEPGKSRMQAAKSILNKLVDSLKNFPEIEMSLRSLGAHGIREKEDCRDTRQEVAFAHDNWKSLKKAIEGLQPNGTTPIAYSLVQASIDFPSAPGNNYIILITDGIEECKGDPCAVSKSLQTKRIILRPFIIGLGLKDDWAKQYQCVGRFFNATNEAGLREILSTVVSQALNNTTLTVNLNDLNGKPTETDVNMTFFNAKNGEAVYNFYHTMNSAGKPDTFNIDPTVKYNIQVQTTPPVTQSNIELKSAQRNVVDITAPQGTLLLNMQGGGDYPPFCIVSRPGSQETINVQMVNTTHKYLVGAYDLEILTLPRLRYKGYKIEQHQEKKIDIPQPGKLNIDFQDEMKATIFVVKSDGLEWVTEVEGGGNVIGNQSLFLLPGNYRVVYRKSHSTEIHDSKEGKFSISSGGVASVVLK